MGTSLICTPVHTLKLSAKPVKDKFGPATMSLRLCALEAFSREDGIAGFPRGISSRPAYARMVWNRTPETIAKTNHKTM